MAHPVGHADSLCGAEMECFEGRDPFVCTRRAAPQTRLPVLGNGEPTLQRKGTGVELLGISWQWKTFFKGSDFKAVTQKL